MVIRPVPGKPGFFTSEWLKTPIEPEDVESDALALLNDPRDTITSISVFSERERQYVVTIRKPRPACDPPAAVSPPGCVE